MVLRSERRRHAVTHIRTVAQAPPSCCWDDPGGAGGARRAEPAGGGRSRTWSPAAAPRYAAAPSRYASARSRRASKARGCGPCHPRRNRGRWAESISAADGWKLPRCTPSRPAGKLPARNPSHPGSSGCRGRWERTAGPAERRTGHRQDPVGPGGVPGGRTAGLSGGERTLLRAGAGRSLLSLPRGVVHRTLQCAPRHPG
jgi:hypothetical protein